MSIQEFISGWPERVAAGKRGARRSDSPKPGERHFEIATVRTAREINRRLLLSLIQRHRAISRAELSRSSGLQRSTVSAIIEELIADGWVAQGAMEEVPRGRKPVLVHFNPKRLEVVAVDIQHPQTTIALGDLDMHFEVFETLSTGDDPRRFVGALCRSLRALMQSRSPACLEGIGVTLPGRVNPATGALAPTPSMDWGPVNLKQALERETGLAVVIENNANAIAFGQMWGHASYGRRCNLIAITVDEGIGVGMILNGHLVRGSSGLAGEFGHVPLFAEGPTCRCGNQGCLEVFASNAAAMRYYRELVHAQENSKLPPARDFGALLRLAELGNPKALAALERLGRCLGQGVAMLARGLAPETILLAGEIVRNWEKTGLILQAAVKKDALVRHPPRLVPIQPGFQPRSRGVAALILQKRFAPIVA